MEVNTKLLVTMTDANQNFSKVARMVDEEGLAVIMRNNIPKYVVVDFAEYDELKNKHEMRKAKITGTANSILAENMEAFRELSK